LKDKLSEVRQRATAMYLIDRLALRAGNEKGEDEADTVGCCSLRYEHITLEPDNILHFDFLGKDSIRYENSVQVEPQVYKNIKIFKKQVGEGQMIFDRLTTSGLNKHLNSYMKGLSAKVFRTYNASITFQQQVDELTKPDDSVADKLLSYNRANRLVAVLCNHQKSASKTHDQMISKIGDRIRAFKYQRMKLRKQLYALDVKMRKKPEYAEAESDLEDEWIVEHEKNLVEKEKERIKSRFEKQNDKLIADKQPRMPQSELKEKLKAVNELQDRLKKERKLAKIEPKASMTVEKLVTAINKIDERIAATKNQATDKEENKEIALGTSKLNYIDPRITVAWCRKHGVPQEKVFSKTLLEKFRWAQTIPDNWVMYFD
jgi:DNA topoisomerase-1